MSKIYVSAVPLTMVRTVEGGYRNVLEGDPIAGEAVQPEDLKRLVRKGFLKELEVKVEADAGGAPAKSASKGDWVEFAVSQGLSEEDANAATKDELVEKYS